ncbi:sulfurtransferase-like selenium metabolism protein YedF [Fusobacterium perfoetens]|uniref:sulfurtransferase-like selenium metabolism protein YedF n=1 Tax=Fusobacterium perfoetens TaxID=852 RepID=UPI001F3758B5|nr:sulfurtransferase-like selenium metabolism protein YedF [Fusobacterium perfoetens]MCF2625087.1 sulfurtransferase-like selenium metabolism protein YedF [Fusobacterium perfoetens]
MIKVNAIGEVCPKPVIMTKKALKEIESGVVEVSVDNETSKENVQKMAKEMGHKFETKEENGVFIITITKTGETEKSAEKEENIVVSIGSDKMGEGEDELGKILIKGFIYALTEAETLPKTVLLYNKGVLLASTFEDTVKDLKVLEERGVEILSCGTCANFYHVQDQIKVGTLTNMYTILERQMKAAKVIKP